jgi:23S rRNA (guanosine2251-2'-O)-methyltransferase
MKKQTSLIYGIHPVKEALESGQTIDKVWLQEGHLQGQLFELMGMFRNRGIIWKQVPMVKLNSLVKGNHQGVVVSLSAVDFARIEHVVDMAYAQGEDPFVLVLDGITDVRNFGAIARTAACAGIHGIVVPEVGSAPIGPDALKTSAGALMHIPVCRTQSLHHTLKFLKNSGLKVVGATEKTDEVLFGQDLTGPVAIVMGSEDTGLDKETMKMCDAFVRIPISKKGVDSLNVSVATGVVVYEVIRQRLQ